MVLPNQAGWIMRTRETMFILMTECRFKLVNNLAAREEVGLEVGMLVVLD